jgi:predicted RNA polymerase sigma factor
MPRAAKSLWGPSGALRGLALKEGELADYQWVHSTKADLYRRLGLKE